MIAKHLPEPSIDRSDVRDAPDFEGLTREAYTHLLEDNRRLIAENKALKRHLDPCPLSSDDIAKMLDSAEEAINESDLRDNFEELVEGAYSIDRRAEDEGFGKTLDEELIVAVYLPREFGFTAQCAVVPMRTAECQDRDFQATRLEIGDPDVALYSVRAK